MHYDMIYVLRNRILLHFDVAVREMKNLLYGLVASWTLGSRGDQAILETRPWQTTITLNG